MSQVYFIDGAALEPTEFGLYDPLTNIWKPKKFDIRAQQMQKIQIMLSNSLTTNAGDNFHLSKAFDGTENNKAFQQTIVMAPHKEHHILKWFFHLPLVDLRVNVIMEIL